MKIKNEPSYVVFSVVGYTVISLLALLCLIPFWILIMGSVTSETTVIREGFRLFPKEFSLEAYVSIGRSSAQLLRAYGVTAALTLVGTAIGLLVVSMTGYALQRKDFRFRNAISFYIYFTTLFSGGLIPWYILMVKYLNLKDSYLAMLMPMLVSAWNIILMKNFMKSIPESITESAKIDGAGDFTIFYRLILPLAKPGLATIGLFIALGYWNDWYMCNIYMTTESKFSLQFFLYRILANAQFLKSDMAIHVSSATFQPPAETLKMAVAVVVTGPVIFLYPFVQKYFVKGLTVGAVKG